jgi:hypothetical protein
MRSRLLEELAPLEFFRELVGKAMDHQRIEASAFVQYYVVDLLARCLRADALPAPEPGFDEPPLALLYLRALQAASHERARRLRETGDTALFVSGFFGDALVERDCDLRYYRRLGGAAYARLGQERSWLGSDVFSELAARFRDLADVLSEVSESTRLTSSRSIVRLYQRWAQTGSRRAAQLLQQQGITPVDPGPGRAD